MKKNIEKNVEIQPETKPEMKLEVKQETKSEKKQAMKLERKMEVKKIKKKNRYMYIGPNLRKNPLKNGQIFIEEDNAVFNLVVEKNQSLKKLYIVVDSNISRKILNTKKEGTVENMNYKKIEDWVKDGEE